MSIPFFGKILVASIHVLLDMNTIMNLLGLHCYKRKIIGFIYSIAFQMSNENLISLFYCKLLNQVKLHGLIKSFLYRT